MEGSLQGSCQDSSETGRFLQWCRADVQVTLAAVVSISIRTDKYLAEYAHRRNGDLAGEAPEPRRAPLPR